MSRILVTYATMAGSTAEVAQAVGEEIGKGGLQVDVLPIAQVPGLDGYDGVVLGGPMIMGWHRAALRFLKQNQRAFERLPLAVFILAMSLTQTGETGADGVPVYVDQKLPKPPAEAGKLSFRERYATLTNYLRPILSATRPSKPKSIAFFGGRLEYGRLKWWAILFVMLVIRAPVGDKRNWDAIRAWAASIPESFQLSRQKEAEGL